MRDRLTDKVCSQKPPKTGRIEIWDLAMPGLCIRIYPSGARTFSLMPRDRDGKKQRRISLWPRYPVLSLAEARKQAREYWVEWQAGAALPEPVKPSETVQATIETWLRLDQGNRRTRNEVSQIIRRALKDHLDKPITSVKRRHIQTIVDDLRENAGPVASLHAHAYMHRLFKWSLARDYVPTNPAAGVQTPDASPPRTRALEADELRKVWFAAEEMGWPFAPMLKLLVLTGQRLTEVTALPWHELNLERAEWILPAARTKNKVESLIPLSPQVMAIIEDLPRLESRAGLVFPTRSGNRSARFQDRAKKSLDELSGVPGANMLAEQRLGRKLMKDEKPTREEIEHGWRLHDLRRTIASGMQKLGVKIEVTEAVLNHVGGTKAGIVGTYQTYSYAAEKRVALEKWANHVDRILTGDEAKVINLPRKGS